MRFFNSCDSFSNTQKLLVTLKMKELFLCSARYVGKVLVSEVDYCAHILLEHPKDAYAQQKLISKYIEPVTFRVPVK